MHCGPICPHRQRPGLVSPRSSAGPVRRPAGQRVSTTNGGARCRDNTWRSAITAPADPYRYSSARTATPARLRCRPDQRRSGGPTRRAGRRRRARLRAFPGQFGMVVYSRYPIDRLAGAVPTSVEGHAGRAAADGLLLTEARAVRAVFEEPLDLPIEIGRKSPLLVSPRRAVLRPAEYATGAQLD